MCFHFIIFFGFFGITPYVRSLPLSPAAASTMRAPKRYPPSNKGETQIAGRRNDAFERSDHNDKHHDQSSAIPSIEEERTPKKKKREEEEEKKKTTNNYLD